MARYIDADKFIAELEQEKTVALEFEDGVAVYEIEHMMNLIGMQPTADVVPKSEVAKEFTCFVGDPNKVDHCPYLDEIEKAKAEVAREIFDEIEKALNLSKCYGESGIYFEHDIEADIAELKKKHTEGNSNG